MSSSSIHLDFVGQVLERIEPAGHQANLVTAAGQLEGQGAADARSNAPVTTATLTPPTPPSQGRESTRRLVSFPPCEGGKVRGFLSSPPCEGGSGGVLGAATDFV